MRGVGSWLGAWSLCGLCVATAPAQQAGGDLAGWLAGFAEQRPAPAAWRARADAEPELLRGVLRLSEAGDPAARAGAGNLLRAMLAADPEALGRDLAAWTLAGEAAALRRLDVVAGERRAVSEFCRAALTPKVALDQRLAAARRLGEVRAQGAGRALEGLWREREQTAGQAARRWIECVVLVALQRLGSPPPAEPEPLLLAAAVADDPALAAHGLEGLHELPAARLRAPLERAILGGETTTRQRAIALCPRLDLDVSAQLADVVEDTAEPLPIRQAAIEALGRLGRERSAPVLIALLGQADAPSALRVEAVRALGGLPASPAGREALERLLASDEASARRWALRGLARYALPASRAALVELVRHRPAVESPAEWRARAEAFVRCGVADADALAAMLRLTGDETPSVLQDLLGFAATLTDAQAVPFLLELLGVPHEVARREAARELSRRAGRVDHGLDRQAWRAWWEERRR